MQADCTPDFLRTSFSLSKEKNGTLANFIKEVEKNEVPDDAPKPALSEEGADDLADDCKSSGRDSSRVMIISLQDLCPQNWQKE